MPRPGAVKKAGRAEKRSLSRVVAALAVLLLVLSAAALCVGRYTVSPAKAGAILLSRIAETEPFWTDADENVILLLRLPRLIAAVLVGGALALSGAAYQGIFRNPLVSSDMLGVSGGACVGAAASILLGLGSGWTQVLAFCGGMLAVGLTVTLPRLMRSRSTVTLVLSGVIVGGFMSSVIGLLKFIADTETQLPDIVYWQLGSLTKAGYKSLLTTGPVMIIAAAVLLAMRWRINLLSLGDREARTLGVELGRERGVAIVCATVLTSCAVCLSGTIGWLSLVMPHIARRLVGSSNTRVLPVAALLSACFLIVIDTLARTLTGAELPLGIFTGFLGAPFFAFILVRERMAD